MMNIKVLNGKPANQIRRAITKSSPTTTPPVSGSKRIGLVFEGRRLTVSGKINGKDGLIIVVEHTKKEPTYNGELTGVKRVAFKPRRGGSIEWLVFPGNLTPQNSIAIMARSVKF